MGIMPIDHKEESKMSRISTFKRGGVHPADKKSLSKDMAIERLPIPSELIVSMSQHLGAPATCLKKKGDRVEKGERIGQAASFVSADVHSPVSGSVTEIRKVRLPSGVVADAVVIKPDPEQPDMYNEKFSWEDKGPSELLALIKDMGIVGMGGATFPTHVKFTIAPGKKVDALVVNGVECEPYLTADYRAMMERAEQVLEGAMVIAKILNPSKIMVGIELNKPDAIEHLEKVIAEKGYPIEVVGLKMKYPQGDEKQLLKATIGKEIPSGKLPLDIGAVVANLGTCNAIYEAAVYHKPLIERIITVSGEGITTPKNILAPVGTKYGDLIEFCGGYNTENIEKLVSGGPMMGFAFSDLNTPMCKGSSGLLALVTPQLQSSVCVSCGKCVMHCPMGLMPNKMYRYITNKNYQAAMDIGLMDCKECGCCAFGCPAHLPLVQGFKLGKKLGRKK